MGAVEISKAALRKTHKEMIVKALVRVYSWQAFFDNPTREGKEGY